MVFYYLQWGYWQQIFTTQSGCLSGVKFSPKFSLSLLLAALVFSAFPSNCFPPISGLNKKEDEKEWTECYCSLLLPWGRISVRVFWPAFPQKSGLASWVPPSLGRSGFPSSKEAILGSFFAFLIKNWQLLHRYFFSTIFFSSYSIHSICIDLSSLFSSPLLSPTLPYSLFQVLRQFGNMFLRKDVANTHMPNWTNGTAVSVSYHTSPG